MIIKKKNFNLTPSYRGKWPFSVPEVSISVCKVDDKTHAYVLLHDAVNYALSGIMESYGLPKLDDAGIWLDFGDFKKSLSPFFQFLDFKLGPVNNKVGA